jgi:heme oxygenase
MPCGLPRLYTALAQYGAMRPSWMLNHLGHQTRQHHAIADADRLAIMEAPSPERYRQYLAQIYCFEEPIERSLLASDVLDGSLRRTHLKTQRLRADLEALGVSNQDLASVGVHQLDTAKALGWLYVLHRNTLLHGLVFRYLQRKLPGTTHVAGSYLSAFEGRAGALLRQLGDVLDASAQTMTLSTGIVAATHEAFRAQRHWYRADPMTPRRRRAA